MGGFLLLVLFLVIVAFLIWVGYQLARERSSAEQEELGVQRQALDTEWQALEQARRVNDVFFRARNAMRRAETHALDQDRRCQP